MSVMAHLQHLELALELSASAMAKKDWDPTGFRTSTPSELQLQQRNIFGVFAFQDFCTVYIRVPEVVCVKNCRSV